MRLFIATAIALAAIATPAAAQHLDARRSQGGIDDGRAYCRFAAYPELKLEHRIESSDAMGTWEAKARETTPSWDVYAYFVMLFLRRPDTGATLPIVPVFGVSTQHQSFPRPVASARALVDGADTQIALRVEGTMRMEPRARNTLRFMAAREDAPRLGALLLAGNAVQLDLLDEQGLIIRSFHWDVHRLHDAPGVLAQAEWKCGNAVNR